MKIACDYFHDLTSLFKRLDQPPKPGAGDSSRSQDARADWDMGVGYEGAVHLLQTGWMEGMDKASELMEALDIRVCKGEVLDWDYSHVGPLVDIGEYLNGNPECMLEPVNVLGQGNVYLNLYVGICASHMINADVMLARGVALAAVIDRLEKVGIRVRLHAFNAVSGSVFSGGGSKKGAQIFMLKDYQHRLALNEIMFGFAHPAMLRRIAFAVYERSDHPHIVDFTKRAYGSPSVLTGDEIGEKDAVVINGVGIQSNNKDPEAHLFQIMTELPSDLRDLVERRERGEDV